MKYKIKNVAGLDLTVHLEKDAVVKKGIKYYRGHIQASEPLYDTNFVIQDRNGSISITLYYDFICSKKSAIEKAIKDYVVKDII